MILIIDDVPRASDATLGRQSIELERRAHVYDLADCQTFVAGLTILMVTEIDVESGWFDC